MGVWKGSLETMGLVTMDFDLGFYKGKKVFLTGHTGFKGSWMSVMLVNVGAEVIGYSSCSKEEPRLFRFLFQSGRFAGFSLEELIRSPEVAGILAAVSSEEGLSAEDAAAFFEPLAAIVHGYASLIANNAMKYDPDAARRALIAVAEGLERMK